MTELIWTNDGLKRWKKIVSVLGGKETADNFMFIEWKESTLYMYAGHLQNTVVLYYEMKAPFFQTQTTQPEIKVIFLGNKFNKAIKSFCSKNEFDHIKTTITTESIQLFGYKQNEIICESQIKSASGEFPDWNATDLSRNNGMAFAFSMQLYVDHLLKGLISLHAKENTNITLKNNQLCFQCADDSGMISQTQHVSLIEPISTSWEIQKAVGAEGLAILQQFLTHIQCGKKETKENESKENPSKKRKTEHPKTEEQMKITFSLDFKNPIFVQCKTMGIQSKIFVATKMDASND